MPQSQEEDKGEKESDKSQNFLHLDTLRRQELQVQILGSQLTS